MIIAIVALSLVAGLSAELVRTISLCRASAEQSRRRSQAEWLSEAGVSRAAARLRSDTAYTGETWEIPAKELSGTPGQVEIHVASDPTSAAGSRQKQATVTASYPRDLPHRHRVVKTVTIALKSP